MKKRDAILKLECLEWAFECHLGSKLESDLKITDEFMQLLYERMKELKDAIQVLPENKRPSW
jgi:hypothetical protein